MSACAPGALLVLLLVSRVEAEDPGDKSGYTLFNPTPRALMREMSTDRPDKTESARTVDAGHMQLEMDLLSYAYDHERSGGVTTRVDAWAVAPINLKVGLTNRADLQLVVETWNYVRTKERRRRGESERHQRGFGDVTTRLKYNLWGNDGGQTAMAAMPFLKVPTNEDGLGNHDVEGGIIFPVAVALPRGFDLGAQTEFDFGRHAGFVNTIEVGRDIVGALGGYVEFFSAVSTERDADWVGTVDFGLTYGVTDDVQLDAGVNVGVTEAADDVNPFLGLSWRFALERRTDDVATP